MAGRAFVIIGSYVYAPPEIKAESAQPTFAGLHGMAIARWPVKPTAWVSEYTGELDVNPSTGHLVYADCVQAAYCAAAATMTGKPIATWQSREALQAKEVAMGYQPNKLVGSDLPAASAAGASLWGVKSAVSQSKVTIESVDDGSGYCWMHDSLNKYGRWVRVRVADAVRYAGTYADYPYRYLAIDQTNASTGGDMQNFSITKVYAAGVDAAGNKHPGAIFHFAPGTYNGWKPDGSSKAATLLKGSIAHTNATVLIPGTQVPHGNFAYIIDGIWAGYYMSIADGTIEEVLPATPDCTAAVAAQAQKDADAMAAYKQKVGNLADQIKSA